MHVLFEKSIGLEFPRMMRSIQDEPKHDVSVLLKFGSYDSVEKLNLSDSEKVSVHSNQKNDTQKEAVKKCKAVVGNESLKQFLNCEGLFG